MIPNCELESINTNQDKPVIIEIKKRRWPVLFMVRELAWKYGQINWEGVLKFVEQFNPDIIFLPFYYAKYVDRVALEIKKHFDIPMVLEASIDIYSLKQLSFDPFFWINRFSIRRYIRKTVKQSEKLYVISEKMRDEYRKMLNIDCGIVYKFPDFNRHLSDYIYNDNPIKFLYTGNIGTGRWKSLACIGDCLKESGKGILTIYTPTPLSNKMKQALKNCKVMQPVSPAEVIILQNDADVLVHAEAFDLKNKLEVRYSISTKVMDYISAERCIFAVGPKGIASIDFLKKNNLALIANNKADIKKCVKEIVSSSGIVENYSKNNKCYMDKMKLMTPPQDLLREDLARIVDVYQGGNEC